MTPRKAPASLIESYHLLSYDEVDSTNEEARRLAQGGASHGAVIWAKTQTEGRGRMGRPWVSKDGNLFVSLLLQPGIPLQEAAQLSFVTSLAAAEALEPVVEEAGQLRLKWPNDLLFNNKKMGGILLETEPSSNEKKPWIIVGFGLNIECFPQKGEVRFPATCLKEAGIEIISAKIVLSRFLSHFVECYDRWTSQGFDVIRKEWLERAWRLDEEIEVMQGEEHLTGIFKGIDETGQLKLKMPNGKISLISAGDVTLSEATA